MEQLSKLRHPRAPSSSSSRPPTNARSPRVQRCKLQGRSHGLKITSKQISREEREKEEVAISGEFAQGVLPKGVHALLGRHEFCRNHSFTRQFAGVMFEDTSLSAWSQKQHLQQTVDQRREYLRRLRYVYK